MSKIEMNLQQNSLNEYYFDYFNVEETLEAVMFRAESSLGRKLSDEEKETIKGYMDFCLRCSFRCTSGKLPARLRIKELGGFGIQISAYYYSSSWRYLMYNKVYFQK